MNSPLVVAMIKYYPITSEKRAFYSSGIKDDYAAYIDKGINNSYAYMDYACNKEKSFGLFNKDGLMTKDTKQALRQKLRDTKSNIWDLVISLETSSKDKMDTFDKAYSMVKRCLPKFLKRAGFNPDNVTWYAGLHTNTDNRHVHISFFENKPTFYNAKKKEYCYRKGRIKLDIINELKADIENHLCIDKESLKDIRTKLLNEVKDNIRYKSNDELQKVIKPYLKRLYTDIPKEGKLGYETNNIDGVRPYVDCVSSVLISMSKYGNQYVNILNDLKLRDQANEDVYGYRTKYAESFEDDILRRIGNVVIKDVVEKRKKAFSDIKYGSNSKVNRKNEMKEINYLLKKSYQLSKQNDYEAFNAFDEYMDSLKKAEYDRLVEAGEIELE